MIANASILDLLRLIMIEELGIDADRVTIYNQKFNIPPKDTLFIYVEYKSTPHVISSRNRLIDDGLGGANEWQDSNAMEDVVVSLYSKNLDAFNRRFEAAGALHSVYAQQLMEANSFKIFKNTNVVPVPAPEGAALLYRFDIEVKVQAWYNKVKTQNPIQSNEVEVRVNDGQPDLDVVFVIPDTDPTLYPQT